MVPTQNQCLQAIELHYNFIKDWKKALRLYKISKNWSLEKIVSSFDPNIFRSDSLRQNIWNQVKKNQ